MTETNALKILDKRLKVIVGDPVMMYEARKELKKDDMEETLFNEVNIWRRHFLDERLRKGPLKHIPQRDKDKLSEYFMASPGDRFSDPWLHWDECISILLQEKEGK